MKISIISIASIFILQRSIVFQISITSSFFAADLRTLHKYNEDGVIVSPRGDVNADGNLANLPKDSPVLAALNGFQNIANSSPNASPRGG